jgi:gamma-glutamyltranspeptidase / glutathione hydrolase
LVVLAPLALVLALGAAGCASAPAKSADVPAPRVAVTSTHGMVASAHLLASEAGLAMLRRGGNAVDAAVAAAFAIGVAEPNASGIGGEGMLVLYLADGRKALAIDYRSTLPARARFDARPPDTGYAAVAVPGIVAGLAHALSRYGTLPLGEVLTPAIRIADEGFLISPTLATAITDNFAAILEDEPLASLVCPGGLPLEAGARLRNPDLAGTLRAIAAEGPQAFYRGAIAERMAAAMAARGGFLSREDLGAYRAIEREPLRGRYRGRELVSAPPPVAGLALLETLQILDRFEVARLDRLGPARVHLTSEALKRGFADYSAYVADPDFVKVPTIGLLSPAYAASRAGEIRTDAITSRVRAGRPEDAPESPSTTALAAIDRHGNVVVITQTISDFFGAKVAVPGTGIILNNEVKNFASRGINAMAPGKRMRTTIAPTIVLEEGRPIAALATPGAARIVSTMVLLISNLLDFRMGIQEAIDAPRFYARDTEDALALEGRFPAPTHDALRALGYTLDVHGGFDLFFGGAQGILRDPATGRLTGGADPRRDGAVVGY